MENQEIIIKTEFKGITLNVKFDQKHEWLLTTKEVAEGYGVGESTIKNHKQRHSSEILENEHFIRDTNSVPYQNTGIVPVRTLWTKEGVIMLGFFIRSERAKIFRKWASQLILKHLEEKNQTQEINIEALEEKLLQRVKNKLIHNLKQDLLEATQAFMEDKMKQNNQQLFWQHWEYLNLIYDKLDERLKKIEPAQIDLNTSKAYVYVFQKVGTEEYKMGKSTQPISRLKTIQANSGNEVDTILVIDMPDAETALALENNLKKFFKTKRLRSEWFALNQIDLKLISMIAKGFEVYFSQNT